MSEQPTKKTRVFQQEKPAFKSDLEEVFFKLK